jgi:hypothetical protein
LDSKKVIQGNLLITVNPVIRLSRKKHRNAILSGIKAFAAKTAKGYFTHMGEITGQNRIYRFRKSRNVIYSEKAE